VDVVNLGVTLGAGDAVLGGVVGCLDVDTVRGTGGGAEETGDALFQAVFVALELVLSAEALLKDGPAHGTLPSGVVLDFGGLEDLLEGDTHSLGYGCCVAAYGHILSIRRRHYRLEGMKRGSMFAWCLFAACLAAIAPVPLRAQAAMAGPARVQQPTPSTSLTVTVDGKATVLTVAELQAMPQKTVTVLNQHTKL